MNLRPLLFLLFGLSGFSALIYESIWTHYLKLFLGHAAYAQTLVLAIFMGGMALGSWICGRYSNRWKNLFTGYAVAEGIIGLSAMVFHTFFDQAVQCSYDSVIPRLGGPASVNIFKWTLSSVLILPQSVLLGMTFPLMTAAIVRLSPRNPGRSVSMLYFTNSIGAAIGVLASGFVLIRFLGLPGTIRTGGVINISLALAVWFLTRGPNADIPDIAGAKEPGMEFSGRRWHFSLLSASMITGIASFIYEIGWIRMLSLVLGSSTHAFELMLSAFIFGLAFGGLWIRSRIDKAENPLRLLIAVQVLMGLFALSTLLLYGNIFEVMERLLNSLAKTDAGYALFNLSGHAIALAVMLPTTFCAGMTLPLITFLLIKSGRGEGSIGAVYAANTMGAIVGVFFAIHVGMPLLGLKGLITFGAGLDMALGLALMWSAPGYPVKRLASIVTVLCIMVVTATLFFVELDPYKMASGVYRGVGALAPENSRILLHRDGKTATVSVSLESDGKLSIRTNGKTDAAINTQPDGVANLDEATMILLAVIPMSLNPQAEMVANIGLGSGLTTHTFLGNPALKEVDTIEIERGMVEGARMFGQRSASVFSDPRSRIYIDDAKTFFSSRKKSYDIIVSEPSNPWVSGVSGLFSEEFYRLIKRYLSTDGLFVQWFHLYEIDLDLAASVFKAISSQFSDFVVYAPNEGDILIVCRNGGSFSRPEEEVLKREEIARALRRVDINGIQDIEIRRLGSKAVFSPFISNLAIRPNSDYYPVLDQNAARTRFLKASAQELIAFSKEPLPAIEMLTGMSGPWDDTHVTPSEIFPKTKSAYTAMALRDYYLTGSFEERYGEIPIDDRQQALQLRCLFRRCGYILSREERLMSLFNTGKNMVPYLTPRELDAVWKSLGSGASLDEEEKEWFGLFRAIGRRDAPVMVQTAKGLLEKEDKVTPARMKYLVSVAMLGNLTLGNKEDSLLLWSRYCFRMFGKTQSGLLFRLLAAKSGAHEIRERRLSSSP